MYKRIIRLLTGLLFVMSASMSNASLIQEVYSTDGTQIGTWVFATESGTSTANVVQADILLAGVQFSLSELVSASWTIDANWVLDKASLNWKSPTYGGVSDGGYNFDLLVIDGAVFSSGYSSSISCDNDTNCKNEGHEVEIATGEVGQIVPSHIPEPTTLALLSLGLAGLGFTRRRIKA